MSIFQGTDGSEYWTAGSLALGQHLIFEEKALGLFEAFDRHWYRKGNTLWFNERLDSPHMGKCTALVLYAQQEKASKSTTYSLSFEVPNEVVSDLVPLATPERVEVLKFQKELDHFYEGIQPLALLGLRSAPLSTDMNSLATIRS